MEAPVKYFLRKTLILVLTVFLISVLTFIAFHIIPGDPAGHRPWRSQEIIKTLK